MAVVAVTMATVMNLNGLLLVIFVLEFMTVACPGEVRHSNFKSSTRLPHKEKACQARSVQAVTSQGNMSG